MEIGQVGNIKELFYFNKPEALFLVNEVFEEQIYTRLPLNIPVQGTVLDVGANIGVFSLFMARHFPQVQMHAFEPVPKIFQLLEKNCSPDHFTSVQLHPFGLSNQAGAKKMYFYKELPAFSSYHLRDEEILSFSDQTQEVMTLLKTARPVIYAVLNTLPFLQRWLIPKLVRRMLVHDVVEGQFETLSWFIQKHKITCIDLLKIDTEKAELDILKGIEEADWPKIRQIVMELHDPTEQSIILECLKQHCFTVTEVSGVRYPLIYAIRQ